MSGHVLNSSSPKEPDYAAAAAVIPEYRGPYYVPYIDSDEEDEEDVSVCSSTMSLPDPSNTNDEPNTKNELPNSTTSQNSISPTKVKAKAIVTNSVKSMNHGTKSSRSCNKITEIVPSDKVELILETMFESDSGSIPPVSAPVSSHFCRTVSDLVGESVEKILKSPSPKKIDETFSPASNGPLSNGVAAITNDSSRNSPGAASKKRINAPAKNKENSQPHSNGRIQPTKSQLEMALTSSIGIKCDKPSSVEKSANINCGNAKKVCNKNESKKEVSKEETYVEVESELAKMFAGIEDSETAVMKKSLTGKTATTTTATDIHTTESKIANNSLPNSSDSPSNLSRSSSHMPSSTANSISSKTKKNVPRKRTRKPKSSASSIKPSKTKQLSGKENSSLDGAIAKRVPVIHIEGPKASPISVQIINSIKTEEEDLSENKMSAKRKSGKSDRPAKKLATDYVLKNYDPSSSDSSWICIFCKSCAYTSTESGEPLGDLFGPYFIRDPDKGESERRSDNQEPARKKKRVESACSDTSVSEEKSLEIWAHENCIIWAPGVHLVGSKLMGLEEAVWDSLKTKCARCGEKGANVGCRARQCKSFMHYACAAFNDWKLDTEKFLSLCNLHAGPD